MRYNSIMKTWLRLLLVLMTVGGGFTGVTVTSNLFNNSKEYVVAIALIFTILYAFVVAAGLFVYDSHRTGPMLVAIGLQIPWVSLPVFEYHFAAGLNGALVFGPPRMAQDLGTMIELRSDFLTSFQFRFGAIQEGPWRVGINLFAAILFIMLWWVGRRAPRRD